MSRFRKLSQTLWHCQYHIVWTPKYRYRLLSDKIGREVENCIRAFTEHQGCEVIELSFRCMHLRLGRRQGLEPFLRLLNTIE